MKNNPKNKSQNNDENYFIRIFKEAAENILLSDDLFYEI